MANRRAEPNAGLQRLEDLRLKLEGDGFTNISFIVVNHQGYHSQLKYHLLREKVAEHIPVYQQDTSQPDVWKILNGNKDDFLIYDRCGRLVYHLGLPYSFLNFPYVEEAIHITYCESKCGNCTELTAEDEEICKNISRKPDEEAAGAVPPPSPHYHHRRHGHGHHGHREHNNRDQQQQSQAGDVGSCWQRTSLSLASDECQPPLDGRQQKVSLKPASDSERRGQETEPEKQSKHLKPFFRIMERTGYHQIYHPN
ncbi:hypothetical protein JRQ81_012962 [Phrynocephalus forsythii]|uniref:Selenoprotein P N-terminal domain-containing protein n=1 Tax=Phrynocephalus forsythii TaxID=171643 RepID=A0A9Q0Y076_9SAUR|nr:hypothetical protein JRQ81_012962 [Phrynocephalus forsythii]